MEKQTTAEQTYYWPFHDHLFVISPPHDLKEMIRYYKEHSAMVIGKFESQYSKAHITLKNDWPARTRESVAPALSGFKKRLEQLPSVMLYVNDFDFFDHKNGTYTIFAAVNISGVAGKWFSQLLSDINGKKGRFRPHITIAKNISKADFDKLWPKFRNAKLQHTFKAEAVTVLRKESFREGAHYSIYKEFPLAKRLMVATEANYAPASLTKPVHQLALVL